MLLLLLSACSLTFGQHFASYPTNAEYGQNGGIRQYKVTDDSRYSSTDPAVIMTMNTLAANGYGQWTVSTDLGNNVSISEHPWLFSPNQSGVDPLESWSPNGSSAWLLLGNQIAKPSEKFAVGDATHPGCQPPGVVSGGPFNEVSSTAFPVSACKVAANLNGSVRYVAVEPTNRNSFFIQGLNDERGATLGPPTDQQIRIELNGTIHGTLPNPPISRQIVRKPIFTYSSASTASGGNNHTVINTGIDYRDRFDIAMDKKYLYIVWVYDNNGTEEVWGMAILLSDGSIAITPVKLGDGARPTVACDVRNNPGTPKFTAAWIHDGNVKVAAYKVQGGNVVVDKPTVGGPQTLIKTFHDPFSSSNADQTFALKNFTHARVLVSSVAGSSTPVTSVYARQQDELLFYHALTWDAPTDIAWFVDGVAGYVGLTPPNIPLPLPIPQQTLGSNNGCGGVVDEHIIAFANPYDNQSGAYNQFHCLYRLIVTNLDINPLIMVRGADNGLGNNPNGNSAATRLLLNQQSGSIIQSDPSSYVGAVNQMGIHVHWRIGSDHHYARDTRSFDEDIEEHTLVTNVCRIADGHTSGAELKNGVKMTVWSDPNYGAVNGGSTTSGMYASYPPYITPNSEFLGQDNIGTIIYASTGLDLTVGNSAGTTTGSLYTMPVCNIAKTGSAGSITINPGSVWEYFGTSVTPNWTYSNMTVNLNGPTTGPLTANLKIHAGATFWSCASFNADHARIDILYDNNIIPINTVPNSTNKQSGLLTLCNTATLEDSRVNSFIPESRWVDETTNPENVVIKIVGGSGGNSSVFTVNSVNTDYSNFESTSSSSSSGAGATILYIGPCNDGPHPDKVVFNGGSFNRIRFHATDPWDAGLEIKNMTITDIDQIVIHIEKCTWFDYGNILISDNTFTNILSKGTGGAPFNPLYGIVIDGFNDPTLFGEVNIIDNDFTASNTNAMLGAIKLINSTANIIGNQITHGAFGAVAGITLTSPSNAITFSYLCDNVISNLAVGINSDHYQGIIKLCTLNTNEIGILSGIDDRPKLVVTRILNSPIFTLDIEGSGEATNNARVDLRGIHGGGDDYAGFNTLQLIDNGPTALVWLGDNQLLQLGDVPGFSNFGENNLIATDDAFGILMSAGSADIGNIDNNFWSLADDFDPCNPPIEEIFYNVTFDCAADFNTVASSWSGSISCSGSLMIDPKGGKQVVQGDIPPQYDTCTWLRRWEAITPFGMSEAERKYDTLRMYIEHCAATDDRAWEIFGDITGAVHQYSSDTERWEGYREWLISVIYLNSNDKYFCACLGQIANTYQFGKYHPTIAALAIWNFMRTQEKRCWGPTMDKVYAKDSIWAEGEGLDPTSLPPLDSLGLGFLLNTGDVAHGGPLPQMYLESFTASPNPVRDAVKLQFNLSRGSFATMQIHDILGRVVWESAGRMYDQGSHELSVDTRALPEGTLYARIATGFGEVKTVKLVKE